jgi:uncharacterized glyoxalase superfamily protein PhnB
MKTEHTANWIRGVQLLLLLVRAKAETAFPSGFIKHSARAIPQAIEIALETPDVDAAFLHAVAHGAVPCTEPTDMPWGQRISRVRDCDGIVVEICSPMAVE